MARRSKPKKTKEEGRTASRKSLSVADVFRTKIPAPLEAKCTPLLHIGLIFLVVALVQVLIPTLRTMAPFSLFVGAILIVLAYIRKRDILVTGYDEYLFRAIDYTYLVKRQKYPTGIVLLGEKAPVESEIYHVAVEGASNIPPLNSLLRVYVPKDATQSMYANRKYFSKVYAYAVEEWDL